MDAKITAAGFDDGTGSGSQHGGGPNPNRRGSSGGGFGGGVLNRRPMDRRPSLGDSSLHTLNLQGEGVDDSESDSEIGGGDDSIISDSGSDCSSHTSSSPADEEQQKGKGTEKKGGGWLSGWLGGGRKKDRKKKNDEMGSSYQQGIHEEGRYESSSSADERRAARQGSLTSVSSVARRTSSGVDETDDLVRPYHRAFHTKERPSFLRRSPMGSLRIMGSDEMYHDAKSKGSKASSAASASASGSKDIAMSSSNESSSSSSSDMDTSKFSSSYQKRMATADKDGDLDLSIVKTQRRGRRLLSVLTVSLLVLLTLSASAYLLFFPLDVDRRAALRSSAQSFFARSRGTAETAMPLQVFSSNDELESCILRNGHFDEEPATSHWYAVMSDITAADNYDHALLATDRSNARLGGMWQNIRSDCLDSNTWYEVQANVLLRQAGTEVTVDCDPSIPWFTHERSCPSIAIKNGHHLVEDIAWTVGPLSSTGTNVDGWYRLYGVFRPTKEILDKNYVALFVARAPTNVDIVVDQVQINPVNEFTVGVIPDCASNLVVNGNAETGDFRYWWIRGNGGDSGHIEVPQTNTERGFVFRHAGYRSERWRGMLQNLVDTTCLTPGSRWRISAVFRYFETNEDGVQIPRACDKTNPLTEYSCPVFEMQFFSPQKPGKATINTGPLTNEDAIESPEVVLGGWNRIVHTITISKEMAKSSDVWLYVQSVGTGFNYELDDVEMVRVN